MKILVLASVTTIVLVAPRAVTSTMAQGSPLMTANETSAIVSVRAISMAQTTYAVSCGNGGYAATLKALGMAPGGQGEGFIPADLSKTDAPEKSGFKFALMAGAKSAAGPTDCNGNKTITKFYVSAIPLKVGVTGSRSFAVNDSGTIWFLGGALPPKEPFGPPAKRIN